MKKNKLIIILSLTTFVLCFFTHNIYSNFTNTLFSILFPVNESIWEHMKMLYTTVLINGIIEYFILKKYNIQNNNFMFFLFLKSILIIPIYLSMFMPIYILYKESLLISISIMLIAIIIVNLIEYKYLSLNKNILSNNLSIILIILTYFIFALLTFYPPNISLFYDTLNMKYGIK